MTDEEYILLINRMGIPPQKFGKGHRGVNWPSALGESRKQELTTDIIKYVTHEVEKTVEKRIRKEVTEKLERSFNSEIQTKIKEEIRQEHEEGEPTQKDRDILKLIAAEVESHSHAHASEAYKLADEADASVRRIKWFNKAWIAFCFIASFSAAWFVNLPAVLYTTDSSGANPNPITFWIISAVITLLAAGVTSSWGHRSISEDKFKKGKKLREVSSNYAQLAEDAEKVRIADAELVRTKARVRGLTDSLHGDRTKLDRVFHVKPGSVREKQDNIRQKIRIDTDVDIFSDEALQEEFDEKLKSRQEA